MSLGFILQESAEVEQIKVYPQIMQEVIGMNYVIKIIGEYV